jgi:hypothetical protein
MAKRGLERVTPGPDRTHAEGSAGAGPDLDTPGSEIERCTLKRGSGPSYADARQ